MNDLKHTPKNDIKTRIVCSLLKFQATGAYGFIMEEKVNHVMLRMGQNETIHSGKGKELHE